MKIKTSVIKHLICVLVMFVAMSVQADLAPISTWDLVGPFWQEIEWIVISVFIAVFILLLKKNKKRSERIRDENGDSEVDNCERLDKNDNLDDNN